MASASNKNNLSNLNNIKTITLFSIAGRLQSELALKLILLAVLNLWVYVPYLFLQHHHFFPATNMSASFFDRMIPFSDQTVWLYLSIYLLMPVGPFLMNSRKQIFRYAIGIVLISLLANAIFLFWPTLCPRPIVQGTNTTYQALTTIDNSFHAFPSLHAAFAIYSALSGGLVLREIGSHSFWRISLWLWAVLILYATLATKQHVVADIIAGSALGLVIYACVFKEWISIFKRKPSLQPVAINLTKPRSTIL
jgi:membrane-associated phospholipid phosphatase